jgi:hypothetical protein
MSGNRTSKIEAAFKEEIPREYKTTWQLCKIFFSFQSDNNDPMETEV